MTGNADIRWSSQAGATSRRQIALWTLAAAVTMSAHAGAAWVALSLDRAPPPVLIEGGAVEIDLAALGFASADQAAAGEVSEAVETPSAEAVEPVDTATEVVPVDTATEVEDAEPVAEAVPEQAQQPQAETPQAVEPAPETPPAPEISETPPIESPRAGEVTIAAASPTAPVEPQPAEPETEQAVAVPVEESRPVEEEVEMAAIVNVPLPTPRPDYVPAAMRRPEPPKAEPKREAKAPPRQEQKKAETPPAPPKNSGSGGRNQADARKGTAQGSAQGRAASEGGQGRSSAGNAAVSNYPGKVSSKIRRALRYPAAAKRERLRGEVHVSFTVSRTGGLSAVRVARSSGSPILDKAAVESVQRAAPFPPIPDGRASWPFTVPLSFTR